MQLMKTQFEEGEEMGGRSGIVIGNGTRKFLTTRCGQKKFAK